MAMKSDWASLISGAQFDAASSLSVSTKGTNQSIVESVNFVVKDSGQYFISSSRLASVVGTLTLQNPNATMWTSFFATQDNFGGVNPTSLTGSPHAFSSIEGVGLFVQGLCGWGGNMPGYISIDRWTVTAQPILAADFDENGAVTRSDLMRWKSGFGTGSTHMQGNADDDGDVDGADFLTWQQQLALPTLAASSSAPIPEPATILLIILDAASVPIWRRR